MKNRTITVTVPANRDAVFAFLSTIENLPTWAPGFCSELRRDGRLWRGLAPGGDTFFALVADERTGVVDVFFGAQPDEMILLPMRVLSQPHGAAVSCTFFQPADWPDDIYDLHYEVFLLALRGLTVRFKGGQVEAATSGGEPFYPGIVTAKFFETWDFYAGLLGFRTVCETDFYVQLAHPSGAQIGVLRHELDGPTPELVSATEGRGFWLNFDVPDAETEHARLKAAGADIVTAIENVPWGDRQFVVRDPNGVLITIAHRNEVRGRESRPLAVN